MFKLNEISLQEQNSVKIIRYVEISICQSFFSLIFSHLLSNQRVRNVETGYFTTWYMVIHERHFKILIS